MLKNAHSNGRFWIIETHCQETPLAVKDHGQIAWLPVVTLGANGLIEQPGVSQAQCPFRGRFDPEGDPAL